jgi:hypothetical protein
MIRKIATYFLLFALSISVGAAQPSRVGVSASSRVGEVDYNIYAGEEKAFLSGGAILDYISFAGLEIAIDNRMYWAYREGSDHNSSANANIKIIRSNAVTNFNEITWSPASTVRASDGTNKYTNASVTITHTGRVIVFYTGFLGTSFNLYYKYSDDLTTVSDVTMATWSAQFEMTTDYPPPTQFILGQGRAIEYNNILYKACHASTNGGSNYEGPIYRSIDNGVTWTFHALMYASSVNQYEEACIDFLPDGTFIGLLRSNPNSTCSIIRSTNQGLTWSVPQVAFASRGKNAFAINPNTETILAFGREPSGGRTIYGWSRNGGTETWTSGFLDGRGGEYMYGDFRWHPGLNAFIGVYTTAAYQGTEFGGPTVAIQKVMYESTVPVSAPNTYIYEYQDILDFADVQNFTLPSETLRGHHQTLINGLKSDGIYSALDHLFIWMNNNASLSGFARVDWVTPWNIASLTGPPTYGVNGFGFNATTQYSDLGFFPNQLTNFTLNNASAFIYISSNVANDLATDFGVSDGTFSTLTGATMLRSRTTTNNLVYSINDNTSDAIANATSTGFYHLQRRASNDKRMFKDGFQVGSTATSVSVQRSGKTVTIGAGRWNDQVNRFSNRDVGAIGFSSALSGFELALYTWINNFRVAVGF